MTPNQLARQLRTVYTSANAFRPDQPRTIEDIGDAYVTLDPGSDSPSPSANRNAVHFLGCNASVTWDDVGKAVALFADAGCPRFFFWLSPSNQIDEIRTWLSDHGLKAFEGTGYPTLLRSAELVSPHETELETRRLTASDAASRIDQLGEIFDRPWPEFVARTADKEGFDHYGVFSKDRLVGLGGLYRSGELGYLGWTAVAESDRGRGGQNALIRARVNRAIEMGCRWVCSETLCLLEGSLRNLQRNGFEIIYDKEVYEWRAADHRS